MKKISLLAISAMAFVGCSIDTVDEALDASTAPSTGRELTIAASFGSADTRIGLEEDEDDNWNFTWQDDDMLGAKFDNAEISANVPFYIQDGFSGNSANFKGVVTENTEKVVFTYPHRVTEFDLENQIVIFDEQGKALNAYGEYYAVLTSEEIAVSDLEEGLIDDIPLSAKYTAIELKITDQNADKGKITKAIMSYTSGETTTTTKLSVTNAPELSSGDGTLLIPFSYEPFTTGDDDSFTVTCIFENGKVATVTKKNILENVEFKAGTHNYMNVTLNDYTTTDGVYSEEISSYSADSYPEEGIDIWVVIDETISDYSGLKAALGNAQDAGRTIELVFPSLTTVVASAFSGCTSLTSISLPAATEVENYAFKNCTSLTSISLPAATTVGYNAFEGCTSLTSISLPKATTVDSDTFTGCTSLTSISLPAAITFTDGAFDGCTSLTSISLPAATTFSNDAFSKCTSLTSISLPKAVTFNTAAFSKCTSLTEISLPAATKFGDFAFDDCTSLTSISLGVSGSGISSIGTNFCDGLNTTGIDLTIKIAGTSNCSIDGNRLTVGGTGYEFQNITVE